MDPVRNLAVNLATIYQKLVDSGDIDKANHLLKLFILEHKNNPELIKIVKSDLERLSLYYFKIAEEKGNAFKFAEAVNECKKSILINPLNKIAHLMLIKFFKKLPNASEALDFYIKCARKVGYNQLIYHNLFASSKLSGNFLHDDESLIVSSLSSKIRDCICKSRILVVGDSHTSVFENISGFEIFYTGASTVFGLQKTNSTKNTKNKIFDKLAGTKPNDTALILAYGEIDIRNHLVKQSHLSGHGINKTCKDLALMYVQFAIQIQELGFKIFLYLPYGSGDYYLSYGSEKERNISAYLFCHYTKAIAEKYGLQSFTLMSEIMDASEFLVNRNFLYDDIHLHCDSKSPLLSSQIKTLILSKLFTLIQDESFRSHHAQLVLEKSIRSSDYRFDCLINLFSNKRPLMLHNQVSGTFLYPESFDFDKDKVYSYTFDLKGNLALTQIEVLLSIENNFFDSITCCYGDCILSLSSFDRQDCSLGSKLILKLDDICFVRFVDFYSSNKFLILSIHFAAKPLK